MINRKITYASARNKGKNFEREVTKLLKKAGINAQRVPMSGALSWLPGDVVEFDSIHPHIHECKHHEALSLNTWWGQAVSQAKEEEVPVLHFTSNYKGRYSMMTTKDFDEMLLAYENYRPELSLKVLDLPRRKNFWKCVEGSKSKYDIYLYPFNKDGELVIMLLDVYLMLRKYDIRYRTSQQYSP